MPYVDTEHGLYDTSTVGDPNDPNVKNGRNKEIYYSPYGSNQWGQPDIHGGTTSTYDPISGQYVKTAIPGGAGKTYNPLTGQYVDVQNNSQVGTYGENGDFSMPSYGTSDLFYGGYNGGASDMSSYGLQGMGVANNRASNYYNQSMKDRGPQAFENQFLANREAESRYGDQNGALMLAREAAMGQAPSEAAWMMQRGLDQSLANQQAMMGSARGNAGIALASGNAAGNSAAMQNQAYGAASQLRANEMAQARGLYGGLAGQQREQDLNRLGMGNQMSQFNAGLNDQYSLGMGQLAGQQGGLAKDWYGAAQNPLQSQMGADIAKYGIDTSSSDASKALSAAQRQANRDRADRERDRWISFGGTLATVGGGLLGTAVGGPAGGVAGASLAKAATG